MSERRATFSKSDIAGCGAGGSAVPDLLFSRFGDALRVLRLGGRGGHGSIVKLQVSTHHTCDCMEFQPFCFLSKEKAIARLVKIRLDPIARTHLASSHEVGQGVNQQT